MGASGTGRPLRPISPAPRAPEKTLYYWNPGQAEGVEVAMLEETAQGQPNLCPRGQQPLESPLRAGSLGCLQERWPWGRPSCWHPQASKCQLGKGHQRLQLRPCFSPWPTWGLERRGAQGQRALEVGKVFRSVLGLQEQGNLAFCGHPWKVASTQERHRTSRVWSQAASVQILAVPLAAYKTLGRLLNFSVP